MIIINYFFSVKYVHTHYTHTLFTITKKKHHFFKKTFNFFFKKLKKETYSLPQQLLRS